MEIRRNYGRFKRELSVHVTDASDFSGFLSFPCFASISLLVAQLGWQDNGDSSDTSPLQIALATGSLNLLLRDVCINEYLRAVPVSGDFGVQRIRGLRNCG